METRTIYAVLLAIALHSQLTTGFSFSLKPVGTTKVTATPGELITYNARLKVSLNSTLSFHVSLPYFQTPILNVEKIEAIGIGDNLDVSQEVYSYFQEDSNSFNSRSQSSVDFGNVIRNASAVSPGDELVVQVQARLLEHPNVTAGAVFWLYFGMHYIDDAVWVIGKSVKVDLQPGPAKIGVTMKIPNGHSLVMSDFEFLIDIFHLPDSKSSATELKITLSTPSYLTSAQAQANGASPAFALSQTGTDITITFSEAFKVGQMAQLSIKMTYSGQNKGMFVAGNIYGSFEYKTTEESNCVKTVLKKEDLQMAFKLYAKADTCEEKLTYSAENKITASSAMLPCCPAMNTSPEPNFANVHWEPWRSDAGVRLADEFIQINFPKKTTVKSIVTIGFAKTKQFVRSFYVSLSQNGVHWKYVTHLGEKKEFEANTNAVDRVINLLPKIWSGWFLRVHVVKRSPAGTAMKLSFFGCKDPAESKTYEAYQRGFLAVEGFLILCNVHPDRTQAKPNCYVSQDDGLKWNAIHPSVTNVIGFHEATGITYGLGVTSADAPLYMEISSPQSVRVISEADWNIIKPSVTLPTVIPLYPVHGDSLYQVSGTSVTVGTVTYAASPEGLLKTEAASTRMIASWTEFKTESK